MIPSSPNRRIISQRGNAIYTRVCELIDPFTGGWNENRLREIFFTVDANRILNIPLHSQGFEDFIAWSGTKHGRYSPLRLSHAMEALFW